MLERFGFADRRELLVFACLVLLVALTPLGKEGTHPAVLFIHRTLLLGIVAAYGAAKRSAFKRLCPYFIAVVAAILGIMVVSVLRWHGSRFDGFYTFYTDAFFIAAFIALAHGGTARPARWKQSILVSVVVIDVGYLAAALSTASPTVQGPFVNQNYLASFLLPGLAVCVAIVIWGSALTWRAVAAGAGVFLFYGIGQTASRGGMLSALALLGLAGLRMAQCRKISWIRIGSAAVLLIVATTALNPTLVRRFLERGERDPYNYQRGKIWLGTLSMIGKTPVRGVGLGRYHYFAKQFTPAVEGTVGRRSRWANIAHNEYLQYTAELGIPGAFLLFATGGYLMFLAWRRARHATTPETSIGQEAALLTALGLGLHALVDNNWTVPVMAAGLAVISQADLLPYRDGVRLQLTSSLWRNALILIFVAVWIDAAFIPSLGLYFNEAGLQAFRAGDLARAEVNHRFALGFLPQDPVLLDNLGSVYFARYLKTRQTEDLDRAEIFFSESLDEVPSLEIPAGHMEQALIQRLTGDPKRDAVIHQRIIDVDRKSLDVNAFNPFIRRNLAEALYNIGKRDEACAELQTALAYEPNYVPGYLRLAEWYRQMGRLEESEKYQKQAITVVNLYKDKKSLDEFETLLLGAARGRCQAMKNKPIVAALALAALFFAMLLPPEAYPDGKLAVILCATFAFFASLTERRIHPGYLYGGLVGFGFLLLHAFFISVDTYRSLEFTTVLWAYYCLFGFFIYAGFDPLKPLAICMVVLCVIVSAYGLYQYFWGFDQLYNYIFYAASDRIVKVPALERVATKRVFSTLALPGTLWGFLVIALPFHAALWKELWKRSGLVRTALIASGAMLFATGFLTRSFGFLAGLLTLTATWLALRYRRIAWNRIGAILIVLAIVGGTFYSARRGMIEGANPLFLRLENWLSAWTIFAANPMGTGLNTFGVVYSRYMLPSSNETQYTHNTALQLLSELGYPVLIAAVVLCLLGLRARQRGKLRSLSPYLILPLSVWVVHNCIDIDFYFGSVGTLGAILAGALLRNARADLQPDPATRTPQPPQPAARIATVLMVALGVGVLCFAGLAMVTSELQFRAQEEFEENSPAKAAATLERAKSLMPLNSSLFHDSGDVNLNLYHKRHKPEYLRIATDSFLRAVALSPAKAGSHTGLSLCLASANNVDGALKEIRIAERLYPDNRYTQSISRLLEQRNAGIPFK